MELLAILIIIYACKKAIDDGRAHYGKSKRAYMASANQRYPGLSRRQQAGHAARHDTGYAAGQVRHGFPQARHGFATGWHQSRQAHVQAMAEAQKAKTQHLETRAGLVPQLQEYRARQQKALEQIRGGQPGTQTAGDAVPETGKAEGGTPDESPVTVHDEEGCPSCGGDHGPYQACPRRGQAGNAAAAATDRPIGADGQPIPDGERFGSISDPDVQRAIAQGGRIVPQQGSAFEGNEGTASGPQPTRRVDGQPETPADTRFFDLRQSGYAGPINQDGNIPDRSDPEVARQLDALDSLHRDTTVVTENGEPVTGEGSEGSKEGSPPGTSPSAPSTSSTEGENEMADSDNTKTAGSGGSGDVTYDGVQREMTAAAAAAENQAAAAEAAAKAAANTAEQMQALEMDPATLGAMADHLDAHEAMKAAAARVQETAETTRTTLARGHSGLSQAHKDAPVDAASKPFYQD